MGTIELKANLANATARDLAQALQKQALLFQNGERYVHDS